MTSGKEGDLAGPGIGDYAELAHELPADYAPLLGPKETMQALYAAKRLIEEQAERRAEPHARAGAADRRREERRERLPRP